MSNNQNMLDKLSFKILTELCHDGRASNARLAQKLGINVSTVTKRTRHMLQNDIVAIKALPNPARLGYKANVFIGIIIDPREIENICNKLMNNPHINLVVSSFGRYDILLLASLREWGMMHSFIKEYIQRINGVRQIYSYFVSEAKKWCEGMFNDQKNVKEAVIDETDDKLIRELMKDGRANYAYLSEKLGISISTVSKRIDSLVRDDIIKIIGIPNPAKLGFSVDAFVLVECDLEMIDNICTKIDLYPEVYFIMTLINSDTDILFGVHSPDPDSLYQFLQTNINSIDGVQHTETLIRGNYLYFSPDALFSTHLNL